MSCIVLPTCAACTGQRRRAGGRAAPAASLLARHDRSGRCARATLRHTEGHRVRGRTKPGEVTRVTPADGQDQTPDRGGRARRRAPARARRRPPPHAGRRGPAPRRPSRRCRRGSVRRVARETRAMSPHARDLRARRGGPWRQPHGEGVPDSGPSVRDRHQVRTTECLLAALHPRWRATPEAAVRRPVRGWVDVALHDPAAALVVATEIESLLRRLEQLLRWSQAKAEALPSSPWLAFVVSVGPAGGLQAPGRAVDANQPGGCPRRPEVADGRLSGRSARCTRRAHGNGRVDRPGAALGASRQAGRRPRPVATVRRPMVTLAVPAALGGRHPCPPRSRQDVASTSASASAKGSRLADVKPATLIRPLPTT